MIAILASFTRALGQLSDGKVLRILARSIGVTLVAFVLVATAGWYAFDAALEWAGLGDTRFAGAGGLRQIASFLLAVTGLWLVWRVVAMAVIQFYAEDVVRAVEARHYPQAASAARDLDTGEQLRAALGGAGRALLANLVALPFALALLFWFVNARLIGREMQDMVWLRHAPKGAGKEAGAATELCPVSGVERFLLGGVVAALLALPFVNFLAPVLGAASATHLVHRKREA